MSEQIQLEWNDLIYCSNHCYGKRNWDRGMTWAHCLTHNNGWQFSGPIESSLPEVRWWHLLGKLYPAGMSAANAAVKVLIVVRRFGYVPLV